MVEAAAPNQLVQRSVGRGGVEQPSAARARPRLGPARLGHALEGELQDITQVVELALGQVATTVIVQRLPVAAGGGQGSNIYVTRQVRPGRTRKH